MNESIQDLLEEISIEPNTITGNSLIFINSKEEYFEIFANDYNTYDFRYEKALHHCGLEIGIINFFNVDEEICIFMGKRSEQNA